MRRALRYIVTRAPFVRAALAYSRRVAPVFMLHRFRDPEFGNAGHDPEVLRKNLQWLRTHRFSTLSLMEMVDRLEQGAPIERAIAFTVDDGYADFARVAAPVFAEFDCPVTVYVTTGFLDGKVWMWWDKLALALKAQGRMAEHTPMVESLKLVPEADRIRRIDELVRTSGIALPPTPPAQYAPITWDEARHLTRQGVSFGPHTVTHPILARTTDQQARAEVAESWQRVQAEIPAGAVPVFCYPNGMPGDFGAREQDIILTSGMRAAVSARNGYLMQAELRATAAPRRYRLPRFGYPDNHVEFIQIVSGVEHAKGAVRAAFSAELP